MSGPSGNGHGFSDDLLELSAPRDDPPLALVMADLDAWLDANPCACEATCTCDVEHLRHRA